MDKEVVLCLYNGKLLSHKNEIGSLTQTWMDLDTVIQSEDQKEKKQNYHILKCVFKPRKWYR